MNHGTALDLASSGKADAGVSELQLKGFSLLGSGGA